MREEAIRNFYLVTIETKYCKVLTILAKYCRGYFHLGTDNLNLYVTNLLQDFKA